MNGFIRKTTTAAAAAALTAMAVSGCASMERFLPPQLRLTTAEPATAVSDGPWRLYQEPEDGHDFAYSMVNAAKTSVTMTMYELNDRLMLTALVDARARGVDVEVLLDQEYTGGDVNKAAFAQLEQARVQVRWSRAGQIFHQKTYTVDHATSVVATGNFTEQYYPTGRDWYIATTDPEQVKAIEATFSQDFAGGGGPGAAAEGLVWSPGSADAMVQAIDGAREEVDFASEELPYFPDQKLAEQPVVAALDRAGRRGAACSVLMTEDPKWAAAFALIARAGCQVRLYPKNDSGLYIHEKLVLADGTSLLIGSMNATATSLKKNRELGLRFDPGQAPALVAKVKDVFERDWKGARAK